jgi:hypothetical protein
MKRLACLLLLPLVVACASTPRTSAPQWLVGTWIMMDAHTSFPAGCASDLPIAYRADGTYLYLDERGTWRLDGDRLTETVLEGGEPGESGEPMITGIEVAGPDSFTKTWPDGESAIFRRCPQPE